jgi:hypothetical protein
LIHFSTDNVDSGRDEKRCRKLPIGTIAVKLSRLSLQDLYVLRGACLGAERRGKPFAAIFWW